MFHLCNTCVDHRLFKSRWSLVSRSLTASMRAWHDTDARANLMETRSPSHWKSRPKLSTMTGAELLHSPPNCSRPASRLVSLSMRLLSRWNSGQFTPGYHWSWRTGEKVTTNVLVCVVQSKFHLNLYKTSFWDFFSELSGSNILHSNKPKGFSDFLILCIRYFNFIRRNPYLVRYRITSLRWTECLCLTITAPIVYS